MYFEINAVTRRPDKAEAAMQKPLHVSKVKGLLHNLRSSKHKVLEVLELERGQPLLTYSTTQLWH